MVGVIVLGVVALGGFMLVGFVLWTTKENATDDIPYAEPVEDHDVNHA